MKRSDGGVDSADARFILGNYWNQGRALTEQQFAVALRLNGETAATTVRHWEHGSKPMTGPVTLAVDMMLPPGDDLAREAAWRMTEVEVRQGEAMTTLGELLRTVGADPDWVLRDLVQAAAAVLRRPPTCDAAIAAEPSERSQHNQARYAAYLDRYKASEVEAAKKVSDPP